MATGKLTQRIRDLIDASGLGQGELAQRAGVSELTLGLFMAGQAELGSGTLDRIADALGLELAVADPDSAPRKPSETSPFAAARKLDWTQGKWMAFASFLARDAHENHGESGQGVWYIGDAGVLCLYSHRPRASLSVDREVELAAFRERMAEAGIRELAFANFPPGGDTTAATTWAILLDAGIEQQDLVVRALQDLP